MPPSVVVLFVGDAERALSVATALERRTRRDAHVLTADPDGAADALDERVDCVVLGALDGDQSERVLDAIEAAERDLPTFASPDVTANGGAEEGVETGVEVHRLDPTAAFDAAEELLATLLESDATNLSHRGSDGYYALDGDWTVVDWGETMTERTGVDPGEAIGQNIWDLFPEARETEVYDVYATAMEEREPGSVELYYEPLDYWVTARAYPTPDGGIEVYSEEITRRKEREAELESTRERLENILERVTDGFLAVDREWNVIYKNRRAAEILDLPREEGLGADLWEQFPEAVGTELYEQFRAAMDTQERTSFEEHFEPLDRWFEVTVYPSEDGLSIFFQDVTDRKRLAQHLEAIQRTTHELLVAETDTAVGEAATDVIEAPLGFPLAAVWRYDDADGKLVPLAATEGVGRVPTLARDGSAIWQAFDDGEVSVRSPDAPAIDRPDADAALYVPLSAYGVLAVYDTGGSLDETTVELFRLLGAAVESALARTERERELARRTERLDDFAAVVSHDLRNPLQVARTRAELVDADGEQMDQLLDALDRMDRLIDELLELSRADDDPDREQVSLADVAREAWRTADTGTATLSVAEDGRLTADPTRLRQLFENLFRNAAEHAGSAPAVRVGVEGDTFYVEDDGPGVPEDRRDEIFERGVSGTVDGTGYGLAIVADIAEGHGWTVDVTEGSEGGARFEVRGVYSLTPAEG